MSLNKMRRKSRAQMLNKPTSNILYGHGIGDVLSGVASSIARNAPSFAKNLAGAASKIGKAGYNYLDKHPEVGNNLVRSGSEWASAYIRAHAKKLDKKMQDRIPITEEEIEDTEEDKRILNELISGMKNENKKTSSLVNSMNKLKVKTPTQTESKYGKGFSIL